MMQLLKSVYYRTSAQTQNLIFRVKRKLKERSGSGIIEFMVLAAAVIVVGAILIACLQVLPSKSGQGFKNAPWICLTIPDDEVKTCGFSSVSELS